VLRNGTTPIIVVLGLDKFHNLEDFYGRLGCDAVLCQVAARLGHGNMPSDLVARIADDEFALCFEDRDLETVYRIAIGLVRSVEEPVQLGKEYHSTGAHVGIVQSSSGLLTVEELLRCAHITLSRARDTKTECCFFDQEMDVFVQNRSILEKDFRAALSGDEIRSYFQSIVDPESRRIIGFESLARWNHPVSALFHLISSSRWLKNWAYWMICQISFLPMRVAVRL
jgi:diguanylate cyclase (GGDEF)-like protein